MALGGAAFEAALAFILLADHAAEEPGVQRRPRGMTPRPKSSAAGSTSSSTVRSIKL